MEALSLIDFVSNEKAIKNAYTDHDAYHYVITARCQTMGYTIWAMRYRIDYGLYDARLWAIQYLFGRLQILNRHRFQTLLVFSTN